MIKKYLSFALCCLLLVASNSSLISAQTKTGNNASSIAKIKTYVIKLGSEKNKRVKLKMLDGTKLKGDVSQSGEDTFTLTDSKTRQSSSIAYRDVSKIERNGLSRGDKIALGIVIGAAATVAVIVGSIISIRCKNEGGC